MNDKKSSYRKVEREKKKNNASRQEINQIPSRQGQKKHLQDHGSYPTKEKKKNQCIPKMWSFEQ